MTHPSHDIAVLTRMATASDQMFDRIETMLRELDILLPAYSTTQHMIGNTILTATMELRTALLSLQKAEEAFHEAKCMLAESQRATK